MSAAERCARFHALHREGTFVIPNPWDVGSARLLESCGFVALATTSAGLAWSLGRDDQHVTREDVVTHVRQLAAAVDVPLAVDSERCYAETTAGVAETVRMLADAGAAGCSIEDYDPATGRIDEVGYAAERVAAAAVAARETGLVLTARAENHFYGGTDLDDTIARLIAYRAAGADVLYAPHLRDPEQIRTLLEAVDAPVNVLALRGGPTVGELGALGVRRISTGGFLARAAFAPRRE
jgi:2-methylisocitrate lyase-like PEP mutase family enzyme